MNTIPVLNYVGKELAGHAIVDDDVYAWAHAYTWRISNADPHRSKGSIGRRLGGKYYGLAREIMEVHPGDPRRVNHKDRDPYNNLRSNLVIVDDQGNAENRPSEGNANGTTGYRGVSLHRATGKYQAHIRFQKSKIFLGLWDTPERADRVATQVREILMTNSQEGK